MEEKICLVMIVKNESAVILNCLRSIAPFLSSWSISDTGSTDGTQEIIQNFFDEKNIPGKLWEDKWENFGKNRTLAFEHAKNVTTKGYYIVLDADSFFVGDFVFPKPLKDGYFMNIECGGARYQRLLLFRSSLPWIYKGVLHEYPDCLNYNWTYDNISSGYVKDSTTGARSQDPLKYQQDALILEKEMKISPNRRDCFYLAQSYRDAENNEEAKRWYLRRIGMGGWNEEIYISYLSLSRMENNEKKRIFFLKHALKAVLRLEALTILMNLYRQNGNSSMAWDLGLVGIVAPVSNNHLFLEMSIYDYGFYDEFSQAASEQGYYLMANLILSKMKNIPENQKERINQNKNWIAQKIQSDLLLGF